jgi:hypothetical protein
LPYRATEKQQADLKVGDQKQQKQLRRLINMTEPMMVYDLDAMTLAIDQDPELSFELWCKEEMQDLCDIR